MNQNRLATTLRWLALGFLTAALLGGQALAGRSFPNSPLFISTQDVAFAQDILEKNGYLKAGTYKVGERDQPTINAVRQFQRTHFLRPSGQLDLDTMGMLSSHGRVGAPGRAASTRVPEPSSAARPGGAAVETTRVARTMPQTGGPFALQMMVGALLIVSGAALLMVKARRTA